MTKTSPIIRAEELKQLIMHDGDFLKPLVQLVLQEVMEAEMDDTPGAGKSKQAESRKGYRSGYYTRHLINRISYGFGMSQRIRSTRAQPGSTVSFNVRQFDSYIFHRLELIRI